MECCMVNKFLLYDDKYNNQRNFYLLLDAWIYSLGSQLSHSMVCQVLAQITGL